MNRQQSWSRTAAPGEVIYSEGFGGEAVIYLIADGKVELSTRCDDKKVVVATLGRGEFFGESALLASEPRGHTAKALSFCQLTVVPASMLDEEIERVSALLRHIVRTLVRRVKRKDDLLATYTHADFLPGVLSYAHVLALMAGGERRGGDDAWTRRPMQMQAEQAAVPLADVIKKCRAIAGHSRPHVMAMLRRMEKLNLVTIEAAQGEQLGSASSDYAASADARQVVTFDAARITDRAQQVADHELDLSINSELELIELADLESLIGVEKKLLLSKLSHGEIAEDVFAFRKSKVLSYVEQKGVAYFSRRTVRRGEIAALEDLAWVDQRTLFEVVSAFDTYDLAKLIASTDDLAVVDRLFSVMTETRRNEVSWVTRRDLKLDPVEVGDIEQRLLDAVRALKAPAAAAVPMPDSAA